MLDPTVSDVDANDRAALPDLFGYYQPKPACVFHWQPFSTRLVGYLRLDGSWSMKVAEGHTWADGVWRPC